MKLFNLTTAVRFHFFISIMLMALCFQALATEPMLIEADPAPLEISTKSGLFSFEVEIANTDIERASGLMFRTDFPKNRAMLFDFEMSRPVGMWMKNTPLPLDMLFVQENGQIVFIVENTVPQSLSVLGSSRPVRYVLEINAGEVKSKNIQVGDLLRHPTIKN